jgi:hypothetical protein
MPEQLKVEVRQVGKLVGNDRGVNDCRAVNRQASLIAFFSSSGLRAAKPWPPQARECGEIRIGKVNAPPVGRHPDRLGLQLGRAKRGVIIDDGLDWQLVVNHREELAHQHIEAAVAGQRDHLPRSVERLDAVFSRNHVPVVKSA